MSLKNCNAWKLFHRNMIFCQIFEIRQTNCAPNWNPWLLYNSYGTTNHNAFVQPKILLFVVFVLNIVFFFIQKIKTYIHHSIWHKKMLNQLHGSHLSELNIPSIEAAYIWNNRALQTLRRYPATFHLLIPEQI